MCSWLWLTLSKWRGCKHCCGRLYYGRLFRVVFVIAQCLTMHILRHMGLQLQTLSFNHQLLCNLVLKTSDAIYHFRVKMAETIRMARKPASPQLL